MLLNVRSKMDVHKQWLFVDKSNHTFAEIQRFVPIVMLPFHVFDIIE